MKATWEAIVNYTDLEATKRTRIITANAQWLRIILRSSINTERKK